MKKYRIESPEQLESLAPFVKTGGVTAPAKVWRTEKVRKNGGPTNWDGHVTVEFCRQKNVNQARVYVEKPAGPYVFAQLKYNTAVRWCKENLTLLEED